MIESLRGNRLPALGSKTLRRPRRLGSGRRIGTDDPGEREQRAPCARNPSRCRARPSDRSRGSRRPRSRCGTCGEQPFHGLLARNSRSRRRRRRRAGCLRCSGAISSSASVRLNTSSSFFSSVRCGGSSPRSCVPTGRTTESGTSRRRNSPLARRAGHAVGRELRELGVVGPMRAGGRQDRDAVADGELGQSCEVRRDLGRSWT